MTRAYPLRTRNMLVSALGITVLLGTPLLAQADQGKWWKPKEGGQRVEQRDRNGQGTQDRGGRGGRGQGGPGWGGRGGSITYRDGRTSGGAWWGGRGTWRGVPVRRDVIRIR